VIPGFKQYAPGVNVDQSVCGLHAIDTRSGKTLGSLIWPRGNQIFALEFVPRQFSSGFVFRVGNRRATAREKRLFYAFVLERPLKD
jgi:hypothetical protein